MGGSFLEKGSYVMREHKIWGLAETSDIKPIQSSPITRILEESSL